MLQMITRKVDTTQPIRVERLKYPLYYADNSAHEFIISLFNGEEPQQIEQGTQISCYLIRGDDCTVLFSGSFTDNTITAVLPQSCYSFTGRFQLVIKAATENSALTVFACDGDILNTTTDSLIDPEDVVPSIDDLLAQITRMETASTNAENIYETVRTALANGELNGHDLTVHGYYETFADLQAAIPNPSAGDCYGVGNEPPFSIYIYDGVNNQWVDNGKIADAESVKKMVLDVVAATYQTKLSVSERNGRINQEFAYGDGYVETKRFGKVVNGIVNIRARTTVSTVENITVATNLYKPVNASYAQCVYVDLTGGTTFSGYVDFNGNLILYGRNMNLSGHYIHGLLTYMTNE